MKPEVERFTVADLLAERPAAATARAAAIRVQSPALSAVAVHWHDYYELGYVLDGTAEHVVNGVAEPLAPGAAFLLSPADFHGINVTVPPLQCVNVVIDPVVIEDLFAALLPDGDDRLPWTTDDFTDAADDIRRLGEVPDDGSPASAVALRARLWCVVAELARRCQPAPRPAPPGRPPAATEIRRAISYVERHFREPIALADAAAVAHLSPNYFSERFRQEAGTSFQAYLKDRRLRFARSLLGSTALGVTEVCHAAGFNSLSYFGRAYRERFGEPPSRPRRPPHRGERRA